MLPSNLWNVHFVILGKTFAIGSTLSSMFCPVNLTTFQGSNSDPLCFTVYHLQAVQCELASKEDIHQPHLSKNVHQVQQLAEDELVDIQVVTVNKKNVKLLELNFNDHLRRLLIT